ncbi:MAG: tatAd 2 [Acidobacteria bacterium]|nr:tatAd 2 [Acidobacteriota bacterium]
MGNVGFPELIVIFVVALLVFGPKRLPELGRSLGRGLSEFRRASSELKTSIEREMNAAEVEQVIAEKPGTIKPVTEKPSAEEPSVEKPSEVPSPQ